MLVDAPALVISQVRDDKFHGLEGPVPVVPCRPDAGIAKANEIRTTVPGQIRDEAWMPFDPPARMEAECEEVHVRRLENRHCRR
jgi:hypothetical protein